MTPAVILRTNAPRPSERRDDVVTLDHGGRRVWRGHRSWRLTPTQFRIMAALIVMAPGILTTSAIFAVLWGVREDGGPYSPANNVKVHLHHLRNVIAGIGLERRVVYKQGDYVRWL